MTIDMKNYSGEIEAPAAVEQPMDTNSFQQEAQGEDYPVQKELLDKPVEDVISTPSQEVKEIAPTPQEENFKALRSEVDRIKAEREQEKRDYQNQIDMLRANQAPRQESAPKPQKMFEGMSETDVPNVSEIRRAWEQRESDYQSRIEELQVAQQYPDYKDVIEKFALPLVKQKPHLAEGIAGARNKALFAYELGKMAQGLASQTSVQAPPQVSVSAQKIVDNARKPGTLAQAGGQNVLSKADYYASMSDQQFMEIANKHLGGI